MDTQKKLWRLNQDCNAATATGAGRDDVPANDENIDDIIEASSKSTTTTTTTPTEM